jgi:hypothetical protein
MPPELAFILAPRQNLVSDELVRALRAEVANAGVRASLHVGGFPGPRPDLIYVLVSPHEYFTLMHGRFGPQPQALKRTIVVFPEPPNKPVFESNAEWAPRSGAAFATNRYTVRALAQRGIAAEHLQLGWTEGWDHFSERERDIDVTFMGSLTNWRARALGSYGQTLSRHRVELVISDIAWPSWAQPESLRVDDAKWDLLGRTKILINIHQEGYSEYLEWPRIVQAISNGAVVVSEHSIDFAPLVPGRDLVMGDVKSLHLLTEMLLEDADRRRRIQQTTYARLREELPLAAAAQRLVAAASELAGREPVPNAEHPFFTQPPPDPEQLPIASEPLQPRSASESDPGSAWMRRALKDLRLEGLELRRMLARAVLQSSRGAPPPQLELVATTAAFGAAVPRVSVLTALYNHASLVTDALSSAARSRDCACELIIVDDGSSDDSGAAVTEWMARHQDTPALLLRHPVNRGLAPARNDALSVARGEFCFVLDADNEVYPHCLSRLMQALDADPLAAFAYGALEVFSGAESVGLMNTMPWQPQRLRVGNYIDAMAMMRTSVIRGRLGGYPTDRRLHGWEDFAVWCAVASAGRYATRVPEILARYRVGRHSMLSLTDLSTTEAFSVIIEANPELMAGIEAPD